MKSFVRDKHDAVLMGIVGASVLALAIGDVVFGEAAYLVFYVVAAIVLGVQVILQRRERARARSGAARSTGSR